MKKLIVLTGAGMSAESGLKTFRDADGLWEGHDVMKVASPEGFADDPELVYEFYNQRRKQLKKAKPNAAHEALATLEKHFDMHIITQNVDDLHEKAGSKNVLHLHGQLNEVRPIDKSNDIQHWTEDLNQGDVDQRGIQLRPNVVWFGEAVPNIEPAAKLVSNAELLLIIGTSMQVYPAAGLVDFAPNNCSIYLIDPKPVTYYSVRAIHHIEKVATLGMGEFMELVGK